MAVETPTLQNAIEVVEQLSEEDQAYLIDIIYRRLVEKRREELIQEVAEARQSYRIGQVRRGTIDDLMAELES
jgi:hypothetical protein